ncbi:MAG: glycosyltransferase family 2 protein [Cytophagaceae bacterium]|nr:glycosyltransferase family 2 protein [Cytophagaceae bacterium]
MNQVAVVILNWNGRHFLERFLPSVIQHSGQAKIVVADNASTDDSVEFVKKHFPSVEIILIPTNQGYTGGYNYALPKVEAKYYVLLNSDIEVTPGWLEPVIALMEKDSSIAACQPKIKSFAEKNKFEYAGAAGGFIDKLGYPFCRGRIFDSVETDEGQYNDTREIFWATGACLFVRSTAYYEAGGLDNDFFAHMEEIDLCWRLQHAGYKIYYCGNSEVYHVGGGTLTKSNPRKTYLNFRNNIALLYKNLPHKGFYRKILLRLLLDGLAGMKFFVSESPMHSFSVMKAHFSIYSSIKKLHNKRHNGKTVDNLRNVYPGSIAYDYFVRKKKKFIDLKF